MPLFASCTPMLEALQYFIMLAILFYPTLDAALKPQPDPAIYRCQNKCSHPHATALKYLMSI